LVRSKRRRAHTANRQSYRDGAQRHGYLTATPARDLLPYLLEHRVAALVGRQRTPKQVVRIATTHDLRRNLIRLAPRARLRMDCVARQGWGDLPQGSAQRRN
jgi:hypothetical protein